MLWRRLSIAALLLALLGVACGGGSGTHLAAQAGGDDAVPATAAVETTTTTVAADVHLQEVAPAEAPTTTVTVPVQPASKPAPAPASIEVDYQPVEGSVATATIDGPNGTHTKSLDSGAAIFGNLPSGTYSVTVTVDTASNDPSVGDARQILNGNSIEVGPGDHATVTCDELGCSGVLNA